MSLWLKVEAAEYAERPGLAYAITHTGASTAFTVEGELRVFVCDVLDVEHDFPTVIHQARVQVEQVVWIQFQLIQVGQFSCLSGAGIGQAMLKGCPGWIGCVDLVGGLGDLIADELPGGGDVTLLRIARRAEKV